MPLIYNVHGIKWNDGDLPYSSLNNILTKYTEHCETIFVKGQVKYKTIKSMLPRSNIVNLESLACPSIRTLSQLQTNLCLYHLDISPFYKFAKSQAVALAQWHKTFRLTEENWD
jgi:hypothetical protein